MLAFCVVDIVMLICLPQKKCQEYFRALQDTKKLRENSESFLK